MSEGKQGSKQGASTLCWDCKKAVGGCSWSNRLRPVKGWTAKKTRDSYFVCECPEFERDACRAGLKKLGEDDLYDAMSRSLGVY